MDRWIKIPIETQKHIIRNQSVGKIRIFALTIHSNTFNQVADYVR